MADSTSFQWLCERIETATPLNNLEARGTVRLALKAAGLDARTVIAEQVRVVLAKVLPTELAARGIDDAEALCSSLIAGVPECEGSGVDSPEAVFSRLGG